MTEFDAIVIGGGSAGLAFARKARDLGAKCLMIERDHLGGTCVNRGCVPKKLLWDVAWACVKQQASDERSVPPDFAALQRDIARKIETIRDSFRDDIDGAGLELRKGAATLDEHGRIVRIGEDAFSAPHIVIATGARPAALEIPGRDFAQTSDDVLGWTEIPDRIVFLGGGYIGCELASIFAALGAEVSIVDPGDRILAQFDADLAERARQILQTRGVEIRLGVAPQSITDTGPGLEVRLEDGTTLSGDRIVAAVGRTPNIDTFGPLASALRTAQSGALQIDDRFETSARGVYAIGDVADRLPLTPVATRDGEALARMLFDGSPAEPIDLFLVATAAFVMPPIAQVGETETRELATGADLSDGALVPEGHWSAATAHKVQRNAEGLLGAALMSETAADMITPFAGLVAAASGKDPVDAPTGVHPTFGEETLGR